MSTHCSLLIQRVFKLFPVNSPDLLNEKWIIMDGISSNIFFRPSANALTDCCVPYLPLCVRALSQICVGCISRNKLEHVQIFASPLRPSLGPLRPLRHLSQLYVFHCAKIDSVQTQLTQGKKRIVGARLNCTKRKL